MAWNHHQPDATGQDDELPAELRGMHHRLTQDGARWRAQLAPADALLQRVAARLEPAQHALPPVAPAERAQREERAAAPAPRAPAARHVWQYSAEKGHIPMQPGRTERLSRMRGWLAAAAALLVVGALAALLYSIGPARAGSGHTTSKATATPAKLAGNWITPPHLANDPAMPIVAPSNAQVVYQAQLGSTNGASFAMERSDDGGATWQALPVPQLPGPTLDSAIRINPLDARNVFVQMVFGERQTGPTLTCPSPQASLARPASGGGALFAPLSNMGGCPALFASTDGGAHWTLAHLPAFGQLDFLNNSWPLTGIDAIQPQEGQLYAQLVPANYTTGPVGSISGGSAANALFTPLSSGTGGVRLVTSADHGMTWQFADSALISQAPVVCSAYAAPHGGTLFALVAAVNCFGTSSTATSLWRSDDQGGHWAKVGAFQDGVAQFFAAGATGGPALLYAVTVDQSGDSTLHQSADGGHTWQATTAAGLPSREGLYQIAGVTGDGSLVAAMLPNTSGAASTQPRSDYVFTLYALKVGGTSWRQLSPPSRDLGQPGYLLVAQGSIWLVTCNGAFLAPSSTYTADAYLLG